MIDAIIPVHNAPRAVEQTLDSLLGQDLCFSKIFLIDDASNQRTRNVLDRFAREVQEIELIANHERRGFTKTVNQAMAIADSPIFFIINSDTVFGRSSLSAMVNLLQTRDDLGIIGPLSNSGGFQSIPRGKRNLLEALARSTPRNKMLSRIEIIELEKNLEHEFQMKLVESPFVNGFCMGVKRAVTDSIGFFDEFSFPDGYGEEIDFCLRAGRYGWKIAVAPGAYVGHKKSQSYGEVSRFRLTVQGINRLKKKHGKEFIEQIFLNSHELSENWGSRSLFPSNL